ncbi:MAG: MFS transporter [Candidatus Odinarchaeota archaeon]
MSTEVKKPSFKPGRNLFSLCLASFIIITGYSVIVPFLPLYANDILSEFSLLGIITVGIGLQIGIIMAGNLMMKFFLAPVYGDLSDLTGRKPIIVLGMASYTILMAGYGFANDFSSLFILRVLSGIASSAVWPVGQALVVDTSDKEKVGRNLGLYLLSMIAGLTTGPFMGYGFFTVLSNAGLSELTSYRLTFVSVSLFGLLGTLFVIFFVRDPVTLELERISMKMLYGSAIKIMVVKTFKSPVILARMLLKATTYRTRSIYAIYTVAMINGFATALLIPIIALFLEEFYLLGPDTIALIIGIVGVLAFFGAPIGGTLSDKIGRKQTVVSSGLAGGFIMILLGFQTGIFTLIVIFALLRFCMTIMQPSFRALQNDLVPESVRGKEFGIVDASFNFGSFLGPLIGGFLYDIFFDFSFDFGNGLLFIGSGITFVLSGVLIIIANLVLMAFVSQRTAITKDQTPEFLIN